MTLYIDQTIVLSNTTVVEHELSGHRIVSEPVSLTRDEFIQFRLEYFENTEEAFVTLMWRLASQTSSEDQVMPASRFYHLVSQTPISSAAGLVTGEFTPRRPTGLY